MHTKTYKVFIHENMTVTEKKIKIIHANTISIRKDKSCIQIQFFQCIIKKLSVLELYTLQHDFFVLESYFYSDLAIG